MQPNFLSIPGGETINIYERDNRTYCPFLVGGDFHLDGGQKEYFSWREIPRESLKIENVLGQGEFGMVMKAMWADEENTSIPVAVKTIKGRW